MPYFALIIMFYHVKIACYQRVRRWRQGARGGGGFGGGVCVIGARGGGGMWSCGGGDGDGGSCRSPSSIFLEKPLEREFTPFFLQMMARVYGGVLFPLIEPKWAERGKGPLEAYDTKA